MGNLLIAVSWLIINTMYWCFGKNLWAAKKVNENNIENIVSELSKRDNILVLKINADMMLPPADAPKTKFKMQLLDRKTKPVFKVRKSVL
jgi:hypothetical protein